METRQIKNIANANFAKTPHLAVILTNRCNLDCDYCLRKKNANDIPFEKLKKVLLEANQAGYRSIGLTGGEVLLYPQLDDLLLLLKDLEWNILFETNGMALGQSMVDHLAQFFSNEKIYFSISLDSRESRIHDRSRGKGAHEKAVSAIRMLKAATFEVRVITVLTGKNMTNAKEIGEFLDFCENLGVNAVGFQNIVPVGKNGSSYLKKNIDMDEECLEAIRQHEGKLSASSPGKNNNDIFNCRRLSGRNLCLSPAGIHPCIFSEEIIIGTLDDFLEVLECGLSAYSEFRKYAIINEDGPRIGNCADCLKSAKKSIKRIKLQ